MNPPIFVQPSNVITVGPIGDVEPGIVADSKSKQVAAIIRPVARVSGSEGSLRMDGANSNAGKTHLRSEQLQDYVNWLLDRIEADSKESKSHSQSDELPSFTPDNRPTTTDPTSHQSPSPAPDSLPAQSQVTNPTIETASSRLLAPVDSETQTVLAASDLYFSTISTDMQLAKLQPAKLNRPNFNRPKKYWLPRFKPSPSRRPQRHQPNNLLKGFQSRISIESIAITVRKSCYRRHISPSLRISRFEKPV